VAPPIFRVRSKLYNNRLIEAREKAGFKTMAEAARAIGIPYPTLVNLEGLKLPAMGRRGCWTKTATRISNCYKVPCEELWPEELNYVSQTEKEETFDIPADLLEPPTAPDELVADQEVYDQVQQILPDLSPALQKVLRARYGLGDEPPKTLQEVGDLFGISRTRASTLEEKALRQIRERIKI
jgi:RNA polymerase sigma factor (sigma-70 family)